MSNNGPIKTLCPTWVRGEMDKLINELDGTHADVMVGAVAVMGEDGYDFGTREQSTNFDPQMYGPVMLQGYNMIAGGCLAKILGHLHEALQADEHFTQSIEDTGGRFEQTRNIYEQTVREFLKELLQHAGFMFQASIQSKPASATSTSRNVSLAAGSQMIGLWQKVAESAIQFREPKAEEDDEPGTEDSERGQDSGASESPPGPSV